jgi:hypothetical protein
VKRLGPLAWALVLITFGTAYAVVGVIRDSVRR